MVIREIEKLFLHEDMAIFVVTDTRLRLLLCAIILITGLATKAESQPTNITQPVWHSQIQSKAWTPTITFVATNTSKDTTPNDPATMAPGTSRADFAGSRALGSDIRTALLEVLGLVLSLATLVVAILHLRTKRRSEPDVESQGHELDDFSGSVSSVQDDEDDRPPIPEEVALPADD